MHRRAHDGGRRQPPRRRRQEDRRQYYYYYYYKSFFPQPPAGTGGGTGIVRQPADGAEPAHIRHVRRVERQRQRQRVIVSSTLYMYIILYNVCCILYVVYYILYASLSEATAEAGRQERSHSDPRRPHHLPPLRWWRYYVLCVLREREREMITCIIWAFQRSSAIFD